MVKSVLVPRALSKTSSPVGNEPPSQHKSSCCNVCRQPTMFSSSEVVFSRGPTTRCWTCVASVAIAWHTCESVFLSPSTASFSRLGNLYRKSLRQPAVRTLLDEDCDETFHKCRCSVFRDVYGSVVGIGAKRVSSTAVFRPRMYSSSRLSDLQVLSRECTKRFVTSPKRMQVCRYWNLSMFCVKTLREGNGYCSRRKGSCRSL
mmetsp:Transcript_2044/g.4039  ORF Transcript_2044/g.4039 Transcript_2044/m.4039 type:complete len:203 (-) Transcript_2044:1133-1741(-)